jgi:hypothetical protein
MTLSLPRSEAYKEGPDDGEACCDKLGKAEGTPGDLVDDG